MLDRLLRDYAFLKPKLELVTFTAALFELLHYGSTYFGIEFPWFLRLPANAAFPINTVVILILVLSLNGIPDIKEQPENEDALRASWQFVVFWSSFWVSLLIFFCVRTWSEIFTTADDHIVHLVLDCLTLVTTACMLLCYLVMVMPTVTQHQFFFFRIVLWVLVLGGMIIAAEAATTDSHPELEAFFDGTQGLIAGTVTALFVGRLESKLIDSQRWIIIALYGYAVLLFAYPILESTSSTNDFSRTSVLSLELILRVLLFWHVQKLIVSGRIAYYMFEYRQISTNASDNWEQFRKNFLPERQS
jgi:hypothetical protein